MCALERRPVSLVVYCNWKRRICSECLNTEDVWTANEFRVVNLVEDVWQSFEQNKVGV